MGKVYDVLQIALRQFADPLHTDYRTDVQADKTAVLVVMALGLGFFQVLVVLIQQLSNLDRFGGGGILQPLVGLALGSDFAALSGGGTGKGAAFSVLLDVDLPPFAALDPAGLICSFRADVKKKCYK